MQKKKTGKIMIALIAAALLTACGCFLCVYHKKAKQTSRLEQEFSQQIYDQVEVYVPDEETARRLLEVQGDLLCEESGDQQNRETENYLEETYGLEAVCLRDMEPELTRDLRDACDYMMTRYPILNGYLTNIEVRDEVSESSAAIALYDTDTFIMNPSAQSLYPMVIKKQILLRAKDFENARRLGNVVKINIRDGFWTEGTDVTAVLVHELGHALVSCIISHQVGLDNTVYIDEKNADAYTQYNTQQLSDHQDFVKSLCENAYAEYQQSGKSDVSYEEFCGEISGYAMGIQDDGGISYDETVAEAISNAYVHGEDMALPARLIVEQIDDSLKNLPR